MHAPLGRTSILRAPLGRAVAGLFASAILLAACSGIPGPTATAADKARLDRRAVTISAPFQGPMHYLRAGDPKGRRVIFVHGTPGSADGFVDYLLSVPPGYEYIAVDRAGYGKSGPGHAVVSLADQAKAIAPLLVKRQGRWPILVGHSLGGPVVAQLAADFPDRVGGVVIAAGSLDPALEEVQFIQHVARRFGLDYLVPKKLRIANQELIGLKAELLRLKPKLGSIRCAVVIVHGTKDRLVPYGNVAYMQRHLTGSARLTLMTLDGVNHFLPWNSKAKLDQAIALFATLPEAVSRSCAG